jgi:hypothetical protein
MRDTTPRLAAASLVAVAISLFAWVGRTPPAADEVATPPVTSLHIPPPGPSCPFRP